MTRPRRPELNCTTPGRDAKIVSSLPMPTPGPGLKRVPRWRTMISPPVTRWPANTFTPRRFASESRPLRLEPSPFLCAIRLFLLFCLRGALRRSGDLLYLYAAEEGSVPHLAAMALLRAVRGDPDLGSLQVLGHDGLDLHLAELCPIHHRGLVVGEQQRARRDLRALVLTDAVDEDRVALRHAV